MTRPTKIDSIRRANRARAGAVKALALAQSRDVSQEHHVSASLSPMDRLHQLRAQHEAQRTKERELSRIATQLETSEELRVFLEAVLAEKVNTARVCESVPSGRLGAPNLRAELPKWIRDGIDDVVGARLRRY